MRSLFALMDKMDQFSVSAEFLPAPEGTVYGLTTLNDDFIVSGSDDNMLTIWKRGSGNMFGPLQTVTDHVGAVRAILTISVGHAAFPMGGFITACADRVIRVYAFDIASTGCELVRSLVGHTGGVLDLAWAANGSLLSGSWDGTARVWDISDGKCLHVLSNHENGTCVIGLPNGDIVVGSTGRKDNDKHVDYKIRVWSLDDSRGPPAYVVRKVVEDHEQAVRDVALLEDGTGYASVGNDGMLAVRNLDHTIATSFFNPPGPDGKPFSIFRVTALPNGTIATANEDQVIRIYSTTGGMTEFGLPGTPWAIAGLSNGDVAVGCGQAGRSKRGHVYVFSARADAVTDQSTQLSYAADMEPPKKDEGKATMGGPSGINVSGPYESRAAVEGAADGQYGFFSMPSGEIMVCSWSSVAHTWVDVGTMEGEGAGDSTTTGQSVYDFSCPVTLETSTGMRSMTLQFNEEDDPLDVATAFCTANGIPLTNVEEVKNFAVQQRVNRASQRKPAESIRQYKHFPASAFIDLYAIDFKKVLAKVHELNTGRMAGNPAAFTGPELETLDKLVSVLDQPARYHSSTVSRAGIKLLLDKLKAWPVDAQLPLVDILRVMVLHPDAAAGVSELSAGRGGFVAEVIRLAQSAAATPEGRPVTLLASRTIFNCFRNASTRSLILDSCGDVLNASADLLQHAHATVRLAASVILFNVATEMIARKRQQLAADAEAIGGAGSAVGGETFSPPPLVLDDVKQLVAVAAEGLAHVGEEEPVLNLLVATGTAVSVGADVPAFAKELGVDATLAGVLSRFPAAAGIREAAIELRGHLASAKSS